MIVISRMQVFFAFYALLLVSPASAQNNDLPIELVPSIPATSSIFRPVFAPNGRLVAATSLIDSTAQLWDAQTGRLLRKFEGLEGSVNLLSFSPDGSMLLSVARNTLRFWSPISGREFLSFNPHDITIDFIHMTSDSTRLITATSEDIRIWNLRTGEEIEKIPRLAPGLISRVSASADGNTIAFAEGRFGPGPQNGRLRVWDTKSRHQRWSTELAFHARKVALSPDGSALVVTLETERGIKIYNVKTSAIIRTIAENCYATDLAFLSRNKLITACQVEGSRRAGTFVIWDIESGRELRTVAKTSLDVSSFAMSPDERTIAAAANNSSLVWIDVETGNELSRLRITPVRPLNLGLRQDGKAIVIFSKTHLHVWDLYSGQFIDSVKLSKSFLPDASVFSADAAMLLISDRPNLFSTDPILTLIDASRGISTQQPANQVGAIRTLAISPNGKLVATGTNDGSLVLRSFPDMRIIKSLGKTAVLTAVTTVTPASYFYATFSPDSRTLICTGVGLIEQWDVESGRRVRTIANGLGNTPVTFSPDGKTFASESNKDQIKIRDLRTGREVLTIENGAGFWQIAFSVDGRILAAAGVGSVKMWNSSNGQLIATLPHPNGPGQIAFTPDGNWLISIGSSGQIQIWGLDGTLLASSYLIESGEWLTITPEGFFSSSENGAALLSVVRGFDLFSIDQFYQSLYRPDLVREKLAGDPRGLVREAASKLDLNKVLASGNAPSLALVGLRDGERVASQQIETALDVTVREGGLGRVEWRVNGVTVGIDEPVAPAAGQPLRLTRGLALEEGDNEVEVVAYNAQNLIASAPARVVVFGTAPASAVAARLFVLAVGLNEYADEKFRLNFAVPDAKALAQALQQTGKGVFQEVDVTLVSDADVKREQLDKVFSELAGKIRQSDLFVFFIAGHGKTVDGRYYFVPQDFKFDGDQSSKLEVSTAIAAQGIAQEQWQAWFARIPAKKSVLLFDTCEAGTLTGDGKETQGLERGAANDRLVQATGRSILTASAGDKDALEGFRNHGLFTYSVLDALERADGDGDGRIDVAELSAYVRAQVTALSEKVFKQRQVPQIRITSNYPLGAPARVLPEAASEIVLPVKPTHQVTSETELLVTPNLGARRVRKLDAKTPLTLVNSENGSWTLVARQGRPIGYVATRDLVPMQ